MGPPMPIPSLFFILTASLHAPCVFLSAPGDVVLCMPHILFYVYWQ